MPGTTLRATAVALTAALLAAILLPTSAPAATAGTTCTSTFSNTTLAGPLNIPAGATCSLTNVAVTGSDGVDVAGTLVADNTVLGGAVVGHAGATIEVHGGAITGALTVAGPNSTVGLDGGAQVGGSVSFEGPGVTGAVPCPIAIAAALTIQSAAVSVAGAGCAVGGKVQVWHWGPVHQALDRLNRPGPAESGFSRPQMSGRGLRPRAG